jgi:hypothetical protein
MTDELVDDTLAALVPPFDQPLDWQDVLDRAGQRRASGPWIWRSLLAAAAVAAGATVLLVAPFRSSNDGGILTRALAAVGDGPVTHIVFEAPPAGTVVNLQTGARRVLHTEREIWYDPARGRHEIVHFAGQVTDEGMQPTAKLPTFERRLYGGLADGYRRALQTGTAKLAGTGVVDGIPVYWIKVESRWLPDVADHKQHEWAEEVAVSRDTYEPVATQEARDNEAPWFTRERILRYETLPAGQGDFTAARSREPVVGAAMMTGGWQPISRERAQQLVGGRALWLGDSFRGIALAGIGRSSFGVRPLGSTTWNTIQSAHFFYGRLTQPPYSGSRPLAPDYGQPPFVSVEELPVLNLASRWYVPPSGSTYLVASSAFLRNNGIFVRIDASSRGLALAAAEALHELP